MSEDFKSAFLQDYDGDVQVSNPEPQVRFKSQGIPNI